MRLVFVALAFLIWSAALPQAFGADVYSLVPTQFQGRWASDEAECARGALSESRLTITDDQITFYESRGLLLGIAVQDDVHLALIYEASAEGFTWLSTKLFELSADGTTLTDWTAGPRGAVRIRCDQ